MSEEMVESAVTEEEIPEVKDEAEQEEVVAASDETAEDESEVTVSIGDESPAPEEVEHAQAPAWVKELRKNHREVLKQKRELEDKLKELQTPIETKVVVGNKPKLEDSDYDSDKYEEALSAWYERKRIADAESAKVKEQQAEEVKAWQNTLDAYANAKAAIKVKDYEEAELVAQETLSKTQQGIILQGAENAALLVYALGKNPAKAKELAAIKDPVKYAFAVAKLETQLKVSPRKAPPPESGLSKGSAPISGAIDSTLERLRTEAERTGDYTKVTQYRRQKRG